MWWKKTQTFIKEYKQSMNELEDTSSFQIGRLKTVKIILLSKRHMYLSQSQTNFYSG